MSKILDFLLQLLSQFAGGPGAMENNLVRFILPAILWGALLIMAWNRQRERDLPREKLLVWGFGMGMVSSLLMTVFVSLQMLALIERQAVYIYLVPMERALAMASIVLVAGAFLRYTLDHARLARRFLLVGLGSTVISLGLMYLHWPRVVDRLTEAKLHTTWSAWVPEVSLLILLSVAIFLLRNRSTWLSKVVTVALSFFLVNEILILLNYATDKSYNRYICPIGNSFPILAIPVLGYVYLREQVIEKRNAEKGLESYRQHLEELVAARTAELTDVNTRLQHEVNERKLAQAEIAQRNANLAVQNTVATILSRSLDFKTLLNNALETVLETVEMDIGFIFLYDWNRQALGLHSWRGEVWPDGSDMTNPDWPCCKEISRQAFDRMKAVVQPTDSYPQATPESNIVCQGLRMLVSVPLVSKNLALGAITLASRKPDPVPPSRLELLNDIGRQIGMAVENAQLYQDAGRVANELNTLHQMSAVLTATLNAAEIYDQITQQSVKLLSCHRAFILAWDTNGQDATLVSTHGLTEVELNWLRSHAHETESLKALINLQQSLVINDACSDPRLPAAWVEVLNVGALLCVPIRSPGESLGTLFLIDQQGMRDWQMDELELVESFVNRAAVALKNANLVKQLEWAAALEERQRLAADMHDGLAQTLSLLGLQVEGVSDLVQSRKSQQAVEELGDIREVIGQASVDVRRSIASLQGAPQPRRSLQDLLAELPARLPGGEKPQVELIDHVQEPVFLPLDQRGEAMYILQEAFLNAHRHAQAQRIQIILERRGGEVVVTVADDGVGFDPGAWWETQSDHFGLGIIHARAARMGARLQIDSAPGQGTCVCLCLPAAAVPSRPPTGSLPQERADRKTVPQGSTA